MLLESNTFLQDSNSVQSARERFTRELAEESLEEAAFLYEHRCNVLSRDHFDWVDAKSFEARQEAHLAALEDEREFLSSLITEDLDDPAMLFCAVNTLCLQNRLDDLIQLLQRVNLEDQATVQAIYDGFKDAIPEGWMDSVLKALFQSGDREVCFRLVGYRRFEKGVELLLQAPGTGKFWAWTLGRIRMQKSIQLLKEALTLGDEESSLQAAIALLRIDGLVKSPNTVFLAKVGIS